MKTLLITTDDEDRAPVYHKDSPVAKHFATFILEKAELVDNWIHIMPMRIVMMKNKYNTSLAEIRNLLVMKVCM